MRKTSVADGRLTDAPASGKTASGVVPIIYQLKKNRPRRGEYWLSIRKAISANPWLVLLIRVDCRGQLVQLEVRPDAAPPNWKPAVTMNFLADTTVPYSTYAKILVDVATAAGPEGRSGLLQGFVVANGYTEQFLSARCTSPTGNDTKLSPNHPRTFLAFRKPARLWKHWPRLERTLFHFFVTSTNSSNSHRSSLVAFARPFSTTFSHLLHLTLPRVFCPEHPTFSLADIDQGKADHCQNSAEVPG